MKVRLCFLLTALSLLPVHLSKAGTPKPIAEPKPPKGVVLTPAPAQSRWSIGAGMVARQIEADFSLRSPGALNTSGLYSRRSGSGRGDVGFFTGGTGTTQYDDGSVGPESLISPAAGLSGGTINTPSQVSDSGRTWQSFSGDDTIYNIAFHTRGTDYNYANQYVPGVYESSDEEVGLGPYVELRYAAIQGDKLGVNILFGYSWVGADLASGAGISATHTIVENRNQRRYTYGYDYIQLPGVIQSSPFPFVSDNGFSSLLVFDGDAATLAAGDPGSQFQNPRKRASSNRSAHTVAQFYAIGSADLDIDLHELVLAPEISAQVGKRLHIGLSVGPTLNFINTDFDSHAAWYRRGSSKPITTYNFNQSGTEIMLGVAAQTTVTYDLTDRIYLQGSASYRYVQDFDVTAGSGSANVDLSSWQGAVGLGIRL
ncbi:MAG: hypothetical protein RL693_1099 [Verrucomicrobiota bacterium]